MPLWSSRSKRHHTDGWYSSGRSCDFRVTFFMCAMAASTITSGLRSWLLRLGPRWPPCVRSSHMISIVGSTIPRTRVPLSRARCLKPISASMYEGSVRVPSVKT